MIGNSEVTTDLERRLLGVIGGFTAILSTKAGAADLVFKAAEMQADDVESAIKSGDSGDYFSCIMWNLCNSSIGAPMISHDEIRKKLKRKEGGDDSHRT